MAPKADINKRRKNPGVRVIGGRIYDSEKGKTCHQCRQKTMDLMASCKMMKGDDVCPFSYCHKCLLNRYGQEAEVVNKLDDWSCPYCRGECNCSFCLKKIGYQPTGCLANTAKQFGFNSVHELLDHHKVFETLNSDVVVENPKGVLGSKRKVDEEKPCLDKENKKARLNRENEESNCDLVAEDANVKLPVNVEEVAQKKNVALPLGFLLLEVAEVELQSQDVGPALQFLEFCSTFMKILRIKKGQPESILRDLVKGHTGRRGSTSPLIRFNVKLLSSILDEKVKEANWVEAFGSFLTSSKYPMDNIPEGTFDRGLSGYDDLEQSVKLRLLNLLCDKYLLTPEMRTWIDEEIANFEEETKDVKEKLNGLRKEEKLLKQKLKDDVAQALISSREASIPITEYDHVITKLRNKADEEHAQLLKAIEDLPKLKDASEASGVKPIFVLENGRRAYWKLKSYNNDTNIIVQDFGSQYAEKIVDHWYVLDSEEEKVVENHILYARNPPVKKQPKSNAVVPSDDVKADVNPATGKLKVKLPLSCPALDKMDKMKAIMNMRGLR